MSRIDMEEMLDRYLQGTASQKEIERVESWLNNYRVPGDEWQQMDNASRDKWLDGLFDEIRATAGINDSKVVVMHPRKILWRGVAAVAAILAIFFTIYMDWPVLRNSLNPAQLTALNVPASQKKQVILADGSKIRVNSESQLRYPEVFNGKTREVYLSGEAYFDIHHDTAKPFIIHTGEVVTTVLGTAFNIKEDSRAHTIIITVTRGKVSVANGHRQLGTLTPDQQISFNEISHQFSRRNVDAEKVIAWQDGDLRFDDITFADAAKQLEQRFKVKISFAGEKVKDCRFSGTALKGERLDEILKVICAFNNATYKTRSDGSITIDGPGCN